MGNHEGPGHGDVTLSITTAQEDDGRIIRSWVICECSPLLAKLEPLLGQPAWESSADAQAVRQIADAATGVPGNVIIDRRLP